MARPCKLVILGLFLIKLLRKIKGIRRQYLKVLYSHVPMEMMIRRLLFRSLMIWLICISFILFGRIKIKIIRSKGSLLIFLEPIEPLMRGKKRLKLINNLGSKIIIILKLLITSIILKLILEIVLETMTLCFGMRFKAAQSRENTKRSACQEEGFLQKMDK